ncbi:GAF domain-containing protein [Aureibacter tunicatorum]|uniref:Methionine-R-sulfoxide reductase with GAF domain n=1 Tax=Aureibacter tunicatorum TaxID=866807 RepID=A0AAE4BTA1_9BACT|nr:GAF domain-containing protein [Aureibacter tunicatorum]MDR6239638.1 putative methionine-R-sulfoxide reductase with GAF domain [Aureibacter tunicatorum]BDD04114.1 hypothetical protein AUTU_15970 [Aureibacter tunicatorum]
MAYFISSIKHKIRLSLLLILFFSTLGGILSYNILTKVNSYHDLENYVNETLFLLSQARKAEKDFILYEYKQSDFYKNGSTISLDKHHDYLNRIKSNLNSLETNPLCQEDLFKSNIISIKSAINSYNRAFQSLKEATYQRGFKDHGIIGKMRKYVHDLQNCPSAEEKVFAFELRRHEKDFFLRHDPVYINKLHDKAESFKSFVKSGALPHMTDEYIKRYTKVIDDYVNHFNKVVVLDQEIGLDKNKGLLKKLATSANDIDPLASELYMIINKKSSQTQESSILVLVISLVIIISFGIAISIYISSKISKPIVLLDQVTQSVLNGNEDDYKKLDSIDLQDEIGSLSKNFKAMLLKLQDQIKQINKKNESLNQNALEDQQRKWSIEGINNFSDLIKKRHENVEELANEVLIFLTRYTKSEIGGIFLLNERREYPTMELKASYAFDRKKSIQKEFEKGQSLIGRSWIEKDYIFITDMPEHYGEIKAGISHLKPASLLIVPIMENEDVLGVIEIASVNVFQEAEIQFIREIGRRMHSTVSGLLMQHTTSRLLEESKILTQELRDNQYNMHLQFEEMEKSESQLKRSIEERGQETQIALDKLKLHKQIIKHNFKELIVTNSKFEVTYAYDMLMDNLNLKKQNISNYALGKTLLSSSTEIIQTNEDIKEGETVSFENLPLLKNSFSNNEKVFVTKFIYNKEIFYSFAVLKESKKSTLIS